MPLFLAFALSCADRSATNIDLLIRSSEPDDLIMGFYLIGESNDTKYVNELFHNVNDPRISHDLRFYGMSVYQSKMAALRNMSGLESLQNGSPINQTQLLLVSTTIGQMKMVT